ncbi:hypothetical protein WN873_09610 [Tetragenococcus halophilus]|uniref:hypothetical protein n=1 Tax=Tetragenococcus halophilus TaxID=51669 RepID=UPI0030F2E6DE
MNDIAKFFSDYINSEKGFTSFHNEVINLPRDGFEDLNIDKLKMIASYLLPLKNSNEDFGQVSHNYKEILLEMNELYRDGIYDNIENKNTLFEKRYLDFDAAELDSHYGKEGRMFRHFMGWCSFFSMLTNGNNKREKFVNFKKCEEFSLVDMSINSELIRNELLYINIKDNQYISNLQSINLKIDADYSPAYGIIKYIKAMKREVTDFEVSILLGRVDNLQTEKQILDRAVKIGNLFTSLNKLDRGSQLSYFFKEMNWESKSQLFEYNSSQQPWFKFKGFMLLLEDFGLIAKNEITNNYSLSQYSLDMMSEDIPSYLVDLENLLDKVGNTYTKDSEIQNYILDNRKKRLLQFIEENDKQSLIIKLGKRSIMNVRQNKNGKKQRNRLIMIFAKLLKDDTCDVVYSFDNNNVWKPQFNKKIFEITNGRNYCEGHHIIEFNNEGGPDIIENILLIDPNTHQLIHHGTDYQKHELFQTLRENNIITKNLFEKMINNYNCLKKSHIEILFQKGILYSYEKAELLKMIEDE